jgi:hypothetical protein
LGHQEEEDDNEVTGAKTVYDKVAMNAAVPSASALGCSNENAAKDRGPIEHSRPAPSHRSHREHPAATQPARPIEKCFEASRQPSCCGSRIFLGATTGYRHQKGKPFKFDQFADPDISDRDSLNFRF